MKVIVSPQKVEPKQSVIPEEKIVEKPPEKILIPVEKTVEALNAQKAENQAMLMVQHERKKMERILRSQGTSDL